MRVTSLALTRFRNFEAQEADFAPGLNLLSGPNGHGKTNLLEAIHYVCLAHSQRTRKDRELIRWGAPSFVLRLLGEIGGQAHAQSVEYAETGHKRVKVDGRESRKLSDLLGHFSVVSFSPEDLDLVRGAPALRRRYLDVLLCQFSAEYLDALRHYNGALKQRNSLLKQMGGRKGAPDEEAPGEAGPQGGLAEPAARYGADVLAAYDAPLVEHGARITRLRRRALSELAPLAGENYRFISDGGEELALSLSGGVADSEDEEELKEAFRRKLASLRIAEREMAAYCVIRGIDYQVEECPMALGNRHLGYKEALNSIEAQSPGTKAAFYLEYLDKAAHLFQAGFEEEQGALRSCQSCGAPTTGDVCAFCRLVEKASTAVPVVLGSRS